jgi:hypothetical protein
VHLLQHMADLDGLAHAAKLECMQRAGNPARRPPRRPGSKRRSGACRRRGRGPNRHVVPRSSGTPHPRAGSGVAPAARPGPDPPDPARANRRAGRKTATGGPTASPVVSIRSRLRSPTGDPISRSSQRMPLATADGQSRPLRPLTFSRRIPPRPRPPTARVRRCIWRDEQPAAVAALRRPCRARAPSPPVDGRSLGAEWPDFRLNV